MFSPNRLRKAVDDLIARTAKRPPATDLSRGRLRIGGPRGSSHIKGASNTILPYLIGRTRRGPRIILCS
jgi:hypothetical protein